jgi:hypothetical protein
MPCWDGRRETALTHLDALEAFLQHGQLQHWRDSGVTEEEIATVAPKALAQLHATFNQWRDETRARLGLATP